MRARPSLRPGEASWDLRWRACALLSLLACLTAGPAAGQPEQGAPPGEPEEAPLEAAVEPAPGEAGELPNAPSQGIEEITITGEILESSTQNEPEAITTFDQAELDTLGIANVDTLALNTPSLHVGQSGQQAIITLRGIGLENLTSVGETGVGFEMDGIHLGRPAAANSAFYDLERLDVLRGPQGNQGGRNLTAGRIALYSKKPDEEFNASGDVTYGNYQTIETRSVLNVPIFGEKLMSRGSLFYQRHQGYESWRFPGVDPLLLPSGAPKVLGGLDSMNADDAKNLATRLQFRSLLLDQQLELRTIGVYNIQKGNGPALNLVGPPSRGMGVAIASGQRCYNPDTGEIQQQVLPFGTRFGNQGFGSCFTPGFFPMIENFSVRNGAVDPECPTEPFEPTNPPEPQGYAEAACATKSPRTTYADTPHQQDNDQTGLTGHANYYAPFFADTGLSDLHLGLVAGWWNIYTEGLVDLDGTNIPDSLLYQGRDSTQTSAEIFLERPDVGLWDFKVGFFWYREDIDSDLCFDGFGAGNLPDLGFQGDIRTRSLSGYGTLGFRPFDNVRVQGGLRYVREQKSANQINETYAGQPAGPAPIDDDPLTQLAFTSSRKGFSKASQKGCGTYFRQLFGLDGEPGGPTEWTRLDRFEPIGKNEAYCESFPGLDQGSVRTCKESLANDYFSDYTPELGVEWQITDASSIAFSATKGFKSGGFPLAFGAGAFQGINPDYPAEQVWEYELSSKNELFDGLLRLNVTGFWTEYGPFQICQFAGPTFYCRGDGSATIRGIEIEWLANPIDGLQINGFFNYLQSTINNFQLIDPAFRSCEFYRPAADQYVRCLNGELPPIPPAITAFGTVDVSGNELPKAPPWAGALGIQYELDFGSWGYVTPRVQTQFQGKTYYRVFNLEQDGQDAFAKVDLKLMWRSENERFAAEAFVYNLNDEDVINSMIVGPQLTGGQTLAQYQSPRRYGVQFSVNYISDLIEDWF